MSSMMSMLKACAALVMTACTILDDFGADADYGPDIVAKNNITYNVYWNVAENEPVTIDNDADPNNCPPYQDTKIVTVVVEWFIKDEPN